MLHAKYLGAAPTSGVAGAAPMCRSPVEVLFGL